MAILSPTSLPPWLLPELDRLINGLPVAAVIELAKSDPSIGRGFRLTPASAVLLRQQLRKHLQNETDSAAAIVPTLRTHSLYGRALGKISHTCLKEHYSAWMGYFGLEPVLLATLLDSRPRTRELAHPWLQATAPQNLPKYEDSVRVLGATLGQLRPLIETQAAGTDTQPLHTTIDKAARRKSVQQMEQKIQQLETHKKKQLRDEQKHKVELERLAGALTQQTAISNQLRQQLREQKHLHTISQQTLEELRAQTAAQVDQLANQAIEQNESQLVRYWLTAPKATQQARNLQDASLPERIDLALEQQAIRDRHFGNRQHLQTELKQLLKLINQIDDAVVNALNLDNTLTPLRTEAVTRIHTIRTQLGDSATTDNSILPALCNAFSSTDDALEVEGIMDAAQQLHKIGIIDDAQLRILYRSRTQGMEILLEHSPHPPNRQTLPSDILARRAIVTAKRAVVIVDGHNVLLSVARIRHRFTGTAIAAGSEGRQWLANVVANLFSDHPSVDVRIYFDGGSRTETPINANARVVYSGGVGDQRADLAIVEYLEYATNHHQDSSCFLITNDAKLRSNAEHLGTNTIEADVLSDWIDLYRG